MFTGLVETTARIAKLAKRDSAAKIGLGELGIDPSELVLGESISVSGVCLTVTRVLTDGFEADVSAETLALTSLAGLEVGSRVNIERSLRLGERMGGHVVLGHVDGVGCLGAIETLDQARRVVITAPDALALFIAAKGSIAVDGVSLTVNKVAGGTFEVMLVPHTLAATTLKDWRTGQKVNLEIDVLARYVARRLEADRSSDARLLGVLGQAGFLS